MVLHKWFVLCSNDIALNSNVCSWYLWCYLFQPLPIVNYYILFYFWGNLLVKLQLKRISYPWKYLCSLKSKKTVTDILKNEEEWARKKREKALFKRWEKKRDRESDMERDGKKREKMTSHCSNIYIFVYTIHYWKVRAESWVAFPPYPLLFSNTFQRPTHGIQKSNSIKNIFSRSLYK